MFIIGGLINFFASVLGTTPAGLRLILSILAGYPLVSFYRTYVAEEHMKGMHHLYFVFSGMTLCILNYGSDVYHSLVAVSFTYLTLVMFQTVPELLVVTNFVFHMLYLIVGYFVTSTGMYHICWTMPHCVLVLRLIGLTYDVADGVENIKDSSKTQSDTSLKATPTLLEIFGFAYFPFTFMIGPHINFARYQQFINGDFSLYVGYRGAGIQRFAGGIAYMMIFLIGSLFTPKDYLLSESYRKEILPLRLLFMGAWGKVMLCQYISCWLLVEGALINLGFTYKGRLPNGKTDWSGCANVKVFEFETELTLQHYIHSFNITTNKWVSRYVFKRLKTFQHHTFSHLATLVFLAAWHGLHSGYYVTFIMEFFFITAERQMAEYYNTEVLPRYSHILLDSSPVWEYCRFIILKSYDIIVMGYGLIPFIYLTFDKYMRVYGAIYYSGHVFLVMWFTFYHFHKNRQHWDAIRLRLPWQHLGL